MTTSEILLRPQVLVNPIKARIAERRSFTGTVREVLAELFQNAQRAGAERVDIVTEAEKVIVRDDGCGIQNDIEGFAKLVWMYESAYSEEVEQQQPLGIGLYSLFAHEQVQAVTLKSNRLQLKIDDVDRWWNDVNYYSQWQSLIQPSDVKVGLEIEVQCSPEFSQAVEELLGRSAAKFANTEPSDLDSPAWGYDKILEIHLNGAPVNTEIPMFSQDDQQLIKTLDYQGNAIAIFDGYQYRHRNSCVNWYGQLIPCNLKLGRFGFYLVVGQGSPVDPIAPTRNSLIENEKLVSLKKFILDALFGLLAENNPIVCQPEALVQLAKLDGTQFSRSNWFVTRYTLPYEAGEDGSDIETERRSHTYQNPPILIDNFSVQGESFELTEPLLALLNRACGQPVHRLIAGDGNRLEMKTLYWKPGSPHEAENQSVGEDWFYERGEWGLGSATTPPTEWFPMAEDFVLYREAYSLDQGWIIGCADPAECFETDTWAWFTPEDHDEPNSARDEFEQTIKETIRLMRNMVPQCFSRDDLEHFVKKQLGSETVEVTTVTWLESNHISIQGTHQRIVQGTIRSGEFEVKAYLSD